jgi:hypothetical protein
MSRLDMIDVPGTLLELSKIKSTVENVQLKLQN